LFHGDDFLEMRRESSGGSSKAKEGCYDPLHGVLNFSRPVAKTQRVRPSLTPAFQESTEP
jgi:hypothetical protein